MNDLQSERPKRTIVGGRPRGRGLGRGGIPRGIEVVVKKASLDPAFRALLLERRAAAAREIGLELTPAETAILDSVPEAQLQAMVDHTTVPDSQRRAFLGTLGAAMLSAVVAGCTPPTATATPVEVTGIRPAEPTATPTLPVVEKGIRPEDMTRKAESTPTVEATSTPVEIGGAPDVELPSTPLVRGIRPDRPGE
jgi:hypothetical protein